MLKYNFKIFYLVFLVTTLFLLLTMRTIFMDPQIISADNKTLRVSYPTFKKELEHMDPQKIKLVYEALLIQNLYSTLITIDKNNQLQGSMAGGINWDGTAYRLYIRPYSLPSGKVIGAKDAYYSLLRLMVVDKQSHGSLKNLICPDDRLLSLNDSCKGLSWNEDELRVQPIKSNYKHWVIYLLAAIDHSIIPFDQLDFEHPDKLHLNLKETTGLYYLDTPLTADVALLKRNPNHFDAKDGQFGTLEFIQGISEKSIHDLKENKIDFITTIGQFNQSSLESVKTPLVIHSTEPFLLYAFDFTNKTMKTMEQDERLALGQFLREKMSNSSLAKNTIPDIQFFPNGSEGRLLPAEEKVLAQEIKTAREKIDLSKKIYSVMVYGSVTPMFNEIFKNVKNIKLVPYLKGVMPWEIPKDEQPDVYFYGTDSTFLEDLSMISYFFQTRTFGTPDFGKKWIQEYIDTEDKVERLDKLRKLHFKILREGRTIPLFFKPYIAVSRVPVEINFSKYLDWNIFADVRAKDKFE